MTQPGILLRSEDCDEVSGLFERELDPADPTRGGSVAILGYGEVSAVLGLADLSGRVLKRMSGLSSCDEARAYTSVVERYLSILRDHDVPVVATELVNSSRRQAAREDLFPLLERVLGIVRRVLDANPGQRDGREVVIDDAQLSNWHWPTGAGGSSYPALSDVGTPLLHKDGALEMGWTSSCACT
jgi:hypothetical protein